MTLIKSISGIRGTIGGAIGKNLTPQDVVECTAAFGTWTKLQHPDQPSKIVVGRDGRISGEIVSNLVINTLLSLGIDVIDLDYSTTPTVEMAVMGENAQAGIIITASHNPKQWNALKFLNHKGEFISAQNGQDVLDLITNGGITYAEVEKLGKRTKDDTQIQKHIDKILALPLVKQELVQSKNFKVVVDCINSTAALALPPLLEALGCKVVLLNEAITGRFAHDPEPLPENLGETCKAVQFHRAHLGIVVDPDVDRLAFVSEDGELFGEEYTLVAIADYILKYNKGNTVSNLSSTRALRDVTEKRGGSYTAAAVGEVNVVEKMKETNAVIGGEGNGGIIYPALHYGRDAMVGIALFLSQLAEYGKPVSFLRQGFPSYIMSKNKITLDEGINLDKILKGLQQKYNREKINTIDGLKIEFSSGDWIHLRRSNTEPIIRIYAESGSEVASNSLVQKIKADITDLIKNR